MSWESSIEYYRIINETIREQLGGFHSARCVMYSVDFADIELLQREGQWQEATDLMIDAARRVEKGGADFLVLCTNTMHRMAEEVQAYTDIPLLHIADTTAVKIKDEGVRTVGLLGTRLTMEEEFYRGRLIGKHGLQVLIPREDDREVVHGVIYEELVVGQRRPASRSRFIEIISRLVDNGAEGIILGCTEIGLLVSADDVPVSVFDTTRIHATAAVEYSLGDEIHGSRI